MLTIKIKLILVYGDHSMQAIILAGGKGTRLKPFTNISKPLMPIGDKSILEIIIEQLSQLGISDIYISCGY